jgi:hypothetical protein
MLHMMTQRIEILTMKYLIPKCIKMASTSNLSLHSSHN